MKLAAFLCALSLSLHGGGAIKNAPPRDVAAAPKRARVDGANAFSIPLARGTSTDHPAANDCVLIRFTAWYRDGSLFSTSGPNGGPGTQCLSALMPALARLVGRMSPGERRRAWLPPQRMPRDDGPDDDGAPLVSLTIDLELIRILKAPATPRDLLVPSPGARRLDSGVWMLILERGSGVVSTAATSKLTLSYSAWNKAGRLLESTGLADHPVTLPMVLTPPAWREPLRTMIAGEKVRLWVPALLIADKPPGDRIYDLQLIKVE